MSVTVTPRSSGLSIVHEKGVATLTDRLGHLHILDTDELDLPVDDNLTETTKQLIKHTIASYAEGEWSRAERT